MDKKIISELSSFIEIQSVSADPVRRPQMKMAVEFLRKKLSSIGFEVEILENSNAPPVLFATYQVKNAKKTIGIYGHYDVQPEDPIDEWSVEPFRLTHKDGKLLGRGAADNKGHIIQNITAIERLIKSGSLKSNIIFLIEGEEECGSESLITYIESKKKELSAADVFFITDVGMYGKNIPQIIYALRGLAYFEIEVTIGTRDLHSGVYGNAVLNPAQVLTDLFSKMKNIETGEILIPGFYDSVRNIDKNERSLLQKNDVSAQDFIKETGTFSVTPMRGVSAYLAPKIFPSLDIHGFDSGFTGEGPKTVIPRKARAKFSCRLVEHQNVKLIEALIRDFVKMKLPQGVKYTLTTRSYDDPFYTSIEDSYIQKTAQILTSYFGHETVLMREGGSVPVAAILQKMFGTPIILTGFILPDSNLHAPDENFDEEMFFKGIGALEKVYGEI